MDTNIDRKLSISLDITFPHMRCSEVSVDTVDSAGDTQVRCYLFRVGVKAQVDAHGGLDMHNLDALGQVSLGGRDFRKGL